MTGQDDQEADENFEDALNDAAMCVFKSGGVNEDLLATNDKQILFYLDLDNETIVDKVTAKARQEDEGGEMECSINSKLHPLLFN